MTETQKQQITPDELMEDFRGRSLKSIIVFTLVVHAVVLFGTSAPYLWRTFAGADTSGMSEDERVAVAVKEVSESLREIAEAHGLKPQDLSKQFAGGAPKAPAVVSPEAAGNPEAGGEPEEPKSALEKEIEVKADGPVLPGVGDEEEDLFK